MRPGSRSLVLTLLPLLLPACASAPRKPPPDTPVGVLHSGGDWFASSSVYYGVPVLQKSFFWDGNGEVDDSGIEMRIGKFVADDVALGLGSRGTVWWTGGRDVYSAELEGLFRVYPIHDWPISLTGAGGYQLANDQIPPGGTVWNFTFSFGPAVDIPVSENTSFQIGATYHHISNALGRQNDRNPSQNEVRFSVGFAWNF